MRNYETSLILAYRRTQKVKPIPRSDAGFVQLLVVAALAAVGGLLTAGLMTAMQSSRQTAALERLVRSDAIAASGFRRLATAIEEPADTLESEALRGPVDVSLGGTGLSLRVEANGSKIDVLAADITMIESYLRQTGLDPQSVTTVLDDVGKARSSANGAAALQIIRAAVIGLVPDSALSRDLTRFGGMGIDPNYASRRVLRAIPDLTPADAERMASAPEGGRAQYAHLSRYFASTGRRFSLLTTINWTADTMPERRLPIEISTSGKVVVLAGPE